MNPKNASNLQEGSREERGNLVFMVETGKNPQPCSSADAEVGLARWEHPVMCSPSLAFFGAEPWPGKGAGEAALHPSGLAWISHPRIPLSGRQKSLPSGISRWVGDERKGFP